VSAHGDQPGSEDTIARRVFVYGMVQGVYFRYNTRAVAQQLNVRGWVRNRADGSVEAFFQGPREAVEAAIAWCREGPPTARVERVEVNETALDAHLTGFSVR
jgi:acylphosphatase